MFEILTYTASFLLYSLFNAGMCKKHGIPECISEFYYLLKPKLLFTLWMVGVAILLLPTWIAITPILLTFLPFLSVIALCIVGICPRYLESQRTIHIINGVVACILSLLWAVIMGIYCLPILLAIAAILVVIFSSKPLYWIEDLAFIGIYLAILLV